MIRSLASDRIFLAGLALRVLVILAAYGTALTLGGSTHCQLELLTAGAGSLLCSADVVARAGRWFALPLITGLLLADVGVYLLLSRFGREERRIEVRTLYWLSPLAILLTFWIGVTSAPAMALLIGAFVLADMRRDRAAGLAFGAAAVLLPSLFWIIPLLVVYGLRRIRLRSEAREFLVGLAVAAGVGLGCHALAAIAGSDGTVTSWIVAAQTGAALPYGSGLHVSILPLVLTGLLYAAWRIRVLDERLLLAVVTLSILAIVLLGGLGRAPALVLLPLLAYHAAYAERSGRMLLTWFEFFLAIWFIATPLEAVFVSYAGDPTATLTLTALIALGSVLFVQVLQRGVLRAPGFLAHRKTISIGVAGDSGVGKDTLVEGIAGLFSPRFVASISGDDYHVWDRNKPMWRALTHLNPKANDLATFTAHVGDVVDRRWVRARHYDHSSGRMTKPRVIRPGEIVVVSGLHALWSPDLNSLYDLRVYLDMDEHLRRFLKIRRDVGVRGHPLLHVERSITRRYDDAVSFVHPQKAAAQLVISLGPRRPESLDTTRTDKMPELALRVRAEPGIVLDDLARQLVAVCGIQAVVATRPSGASELLVAGEPSRRDVATVGARIAPEMTRLQLSAPNWDEGLRGVIQLLMLDQLEQVHRRRSVNA